MNIWDEQVGTNTDEEPTPIGTIVSAIFFALFGLVAACGNAIVIIVFLSQPSLRSSMNMYLASLALSDLIVATLVMPLAIVQHVYAGRWLFGRTTCDLWHATDVCASTASILNLCFIAIERYEAISDPIRHQAASTKRTIARICCVWVLSALISYPAIAWWHSRMPLHLQRHQIIRQEVYDEISCAISHSVAQMNTPNGTVLSLPVFRLNHSIINFTDDTERAHSELLCEFTDDPYYLIASSMISYYVPCALMIVVYSAVYRTAVRVRKGNASGCRIVAKTSCGAGDGSMVLRVHRGGTPCSSTKSHRQKHIRTENDRQLCAIAEETHTCTNSPLLLNPSPKEEETKKPFRFHHLNEVKAQFKRLVREQKAAKMLGMIMAVFFISWTPFFVCNLLIAFQSLDIIQKLISEEHEELVMTTVTWLGYASSCLNPFIYGFTLRDFRVAFLTKICCWQRRARKKSPGTQTKLNGATSSKYETESAILDALERRTTSP